MPWCKSVHDELLRKWNIMKYNENYYFIYLCIPLFGNISRCKTLDRVWRIMAQTTGHQPNVCFMNYKKLTLNPSCMPTRKVKFCPKTRLSFFQPKKNMKLSYCRGTVLRTTSFDSDPIPTWLLEECASVLVPTITNIVNFSLTSGQFHPILKSHFSTA